MAMMIIMTMVMVISDEIVMVVALEMEAMGNYDGGDGGYGDGSCDGDSDDSIQHLLSNVPGSIPSTS